MRDGRGGREGGTAENSLNDTLERASPRAVVPARTEVGQVAGIVSYRETATWTVRDIDRL